MKGIKGVVLAGGLGTRLHPLTKVTNKHLLPVYNRPMVYYPVEKLVKAGIEQIMIVTGGNHAGEFLRLLGNGKEFGLKELHYAYQEGEGGIAEALGLTEDFVGTDRVCVILGDNIFEQDLGPSLKRFMDQPNGARVFLKQVSNPEKFGVAVLDKDKIIKIEEKPKVPKSNYIIIGIYMYDNTVFDVVKGLKPSVRNELEITDVNNCYINRGNLHYEILTGWWTDAGTFESLLVANNLVAACVRRG